MITHATALCERCSLRQPPAPVCLRCTGVPTDLRYADQALSSHARPARGSEHPRDPRQKPPRISLLPPVPRDRDTVFVRGTVIEAHGPSLPFSDDQDIAVRTTAPGTTPLDDGFLRAFVVHSDRDVVVYVENGPGAVIDIETPRILTGDLTAEELTALRERAIHPIPHRIHVGHVSLGDRIEVRGLPRVRRVPSGYRGTRVDQELYGGDRAPLWLRRLSGPEKETQRTP